MDALILNKKTIVIWNNLTDSQATELENTLLDIIREYQRCLHNMGNIKGNLTIPIPIDEQGRYLSVVKKGDNILIYTSKNNDGKYYGTPVLNGDYLYLQRNIITGVYKHIIQRSANIFTKNHETWLNINYSESIESFLLSPNPNPEDFIANLNRDTLSQMYKNFLREVELTLPNAKTIELPENDYGKE